MVSQLDFKTPSLDSADWMAGLTQTHVVFYLQKRISGYPDIRAGIDELAGLLLPKSLAQKASLTQDKIWRYVSTNIKNSRPYERRERLTLEQEMQFDRLSTELEKSENKRILSAAQVMALVIFDPIELVMAGINCENRELVRMAGYLLHYGGYQKANPGQPLYISLCTFRPTYDFVTLATMKTAADFSGDRHLANLAEYALATNSPV